MIGKFFKANQPNGGLNAALTRLFYTKSAFFKDPLWPTRSLFDN